MLFEMASILALDIGGTEIKAARVDETGRVEHSAGAASPSGLEHFRTVVCTLLQRLTKDGTPIVGVGIGCKGIINPATTVVDVLPGPMQYLEGQRLEKLVQPALCPGTRVCADNDARAAIVGERLWGAARNCTDALLLTLGTGVGGGVLSDGRILRGPTGVAGHIGHLTVETEGEPCICGNRGCLETVFSARAIEAAAFALTHHGVASKLTERAAVGPVTCRDVFRIAEEGDAMARDIVARAARKLAGAVAGLAHVFDPQVVILGGQIAESGEFLFALIRDDIQERTRTLLRRDVPIVPSQVRSGVLGAAALVLEQGR